MDEHTPTPWEDDGVGIEGADHFCVMEFDDGHSPEDAINRPRVIACVNAFHDPKRTIATEQIGEGCFWQARDLIESLIADQTSSYCEWCESHAEKDDAGNLIGRVRHKIGCPAKNASDFLSSLKIEEPTDG